MMPVIAPCRSGLHQTCPSDQSDELAQLLHLGMSRRARRRAAAGRVGSKIRVSAPSFEQPRRLQGQEAAVGALAQRAVEQQDARPVRGGGADEPRRCRARRRLARRCSANRAAVSQRGGPSSSTTTSPSSLVKDPCWARAGFRGPFGGRHRRVPNGVTTKGRLMRMGCASIASSNCSSVNFGSPRPSSAKGVPFLAQRLAHRDAASPISSAQLLPDGGVFRYSITVGLDAGVADQRERVAGGPALRVVVDGDGGHGVLISEVKLSLQSSVADVAKPAGARSTGTLPRYQRAKCANAAARG